MLKIAICDDVIETTSQLEKVIIEISKTHFIETDIEVFYSGDDLLRYIKNKDSFDLIFLDIEMGTLDGIEVGLQIRKYMRDYDIEIVYISGKPTYAMDLFQVHPFHFLLKPLKFNDVENILLTYLDIHSKSFYFKYKKGHKYNKINIGDIMYFEGNNRKINIVSKNNTDSFYGLMSKIHEDTKDLGFLYIHKSYIINTAYISSYMYDKVILLNDREIPISQSRRKIIRNKILTSNKNRGE